MFTLPPVQPSAKKQLSTENSSMKGNLVMRLLIVISCIALSSCQSANSFDPDKQDKLEAVYKIRSKLEARGYPQNTSINRLEELIEVKRGRAVNGGSSDLLRTHPKARSDAYSSLLRPSSLRGARISHFAGGLLTLLLF